MNENDARQHLYRILAGPSLAQAVAVAARLGLPDRLADGARTTLALAETCGADPDALERLLRALVGLGVVYRGADGWGLGPLGGPLRRDAPGGLHAMAALTGAPWRAATADLERAVRTGCSPFSERFGTSLYEWLAMHPDEATHFDAVQAAHAASVDLSVVDWSGVGTVVDVGGGTGGVLRRLLAAAPHLGGIVFDTPGARAAAEAAIAGDGLAPRCTFVGGDFFVSVPAGDVGILGFVLHNWDDARATRILERCRESLGRVVVMDNLVDPTAPSAQAALLDLEMLVFTEGGRERSTAEILGLLERAGFTRARVLGGRAGVGVIEAIRPG